MEPSVYISDHESPHCTMTSYDGDDNLTLCVPRLSSGQDPNQPVIVRSPKLKHLPPNHVLIRVDRFGFSANKYVVFL